MRSLFNLNRASVKGFGLLALFSFGLLYLLPAQSPSEEFGWIKSAYPTKNSVYMDYQWQIDIELKRGKVLSSLTTIEERICLGEDDVNAREGSISYSSWVTLDELEVVTKIPGKSKYDNIKVKDFNEYTMDGPAFFDDQKTVQYHWPKITQGAKKFKKVKRTYVDPHFTPSLYTSVYLPVVNGQFQLNVDQDIDVEIIPMNMEILGATYTEEKKRGKKSHTWLFQNYDAFKYEPDAAQIWKFAPHVLVRVKSYKSKEGETNVLGDVSDLHSWYCSLLRDEDLEDTEISSVVDSLTQNVSNDRDAASVIYGWVQNYIKYVAVEDGINGFQPELASKVCQNKFGDCKGMSNLLHGMYELYGLESHLTWVGTREIVYTYDQLPTPTTDNHMILTLELDGNLIFLDPTDDKLPFGVPSTMTQGKQALISYNCDSFELAYVPIIPAEENMLQDSVDVRIDGLDLIGEGTATLSGYSRTFFVRGLANSDYEYLKKYSREYLTKGSNKFTIDTVWIENVDNPNVPLRIHYSFRIGDYVIKAGNEYYVDLNLEPKFNIEQTEEDRWSPLMLHFQSVVQSNVRLHLEDNQSVDHLPSNRNLDYEHFGFKLDFSKEMDIVTRTSSIKYKFIDLMPEQFETWNNFNKEISKSVRETLLISSND